MPDYRIVTLADGPEMRAELNKLAAQAWPEFMMHDLSCEKHAHLLADRFPEYQFVILADTGEPVAAGNSLPLPWQGEPEDLPDEGIDWMLTTLAGGESFVPANQFAFQVVVRRDWLGRGLSGRAVEAMAEIGRRHGCRNLFAPVRPNRKTDYPLIPMEKYIRWTDGAGLPFDPWMRVHTRLGAEIVKVCPRSMYIPGTVAQWEDWTGLRMPASGAFIVPGALVPVTVDRERDLGEYIEPNVWMRHRLG